MRKLYFSIPVYFFFFLCGYSSLKSASTVDSNEVSAVTPQAIFLSVPAVSIGEDILAIETKLKDHHSCTLPEAKRLLAFLTESPQGLTQEEIAEALWVSLTSLSSFLSMSESDGGIVLRNLSWYYENNPQCPLSLLKMAWNSLELPASMKVEEIFMDAKKYILLPKPLKNKTLIKEYLRDLIGGSKENLEIISKAILIDKEQLLTFLASEDRDSFRSVYSCLRSYYCGDDKDLKPLSKLIAERDRERSNGLMGFFRSFTLSAPRKYERIKTE
jgi:hypothetical protein